MRAETDSNATPRGSPPVLVLDPEGETRRWLRLGLRAERWLARIDRALLILALTLSVLLPTLAMVLNRFSLPASPWLQLLPRFALLAIAFVGAAAATRHHGHICLDLATRFLPPAIGRWTQWVAEIISAVVAVLLLVGAWELMGLERDAGTQIQQLLPAWVPGLFLVWGFLFCALRFWLRAARLHWGAVALVPGTLTALYLLPECTLFGVCAGALVVGMIVGTPLFVVLGGASVLLFWSTGQELSAVHADTFGLSGKDTLIALPLFTLMGAVLARSEAPARLVRVARAWLGWMPGGLAVAAVVVSAFFTTFTGASGVTILALGLLLHRLLCEEGYSDRVATGVVTASGSIGLMFAPALPLMVYGIVAKVDIRLMFKAGITPGLLLVGLVALTAVGLARQGGLARHPFVIAEAWQALKGGIWELLLPVLVLGLFLSGVAGVVESAATGVVYVLLVAVWIHRDLHWRRHIPGLAVESATLIGAVLIILALAYGLTGFLVEEQVPQSMVGWARQSITNKWMFLFGLNLLLVAVGCLLDIFSAIIIFVPLVLPVATFFGIHPVHLGIIFLANLEIGYLTPPVGLNLFLSSFRFKKPLPELWRTVVPFLLVLLLALVLLTFIPALSLWSVPAGAAIEPFGLP